MVSVGVTSGLGRILRINAEAGDRFSMASGLLGAPDPSTTRAFEPM